jgi:hypothetical protein
MKMSIKIIFLWVVLVVVLLVCFGICYSTPKWIARNGSYVELYLISGIFPKNAIDENFRLCVSQLTSGRMGREQEIQVAAYEGEKALSIANSLRELYEKAAFKSSERHDKSAYRERSIYIEVFYENAWGFSRLESINESEVRFFVDTNSSSYRVIKIKELPIDISAYLGNP